ncbi:MAG: quinone-dependent dihydroorotate dehydrogenase [Deltaproteobacteria bacterium]|nr:quinone-dependent dihydroorotate dehydrogenase [Deltaproteobacteria bacterium]
MNPARPRRAILQFVLYERIVRPVLFLSDPETAHASAMGVLRALGRGHGLAPAVRRRMIADARPAEAWGIRFPSRLGVAAGFDKDATALWGLYALGFGFVEVGSVSARPWPGNPRPRVFRLPADRALVNRMGLPSQGVAAVVPRLASRPPFPVLVNVAKTADPGLNGDAAVEDICATVAAVLPHCDAVVLNLSCPNTADGRTFEDPAALRELLGAVRRVPGPPRPIAAKLSPDLAPDALAAVVDEAVRGGVRGFVATNTTRSRPGLATPDPPSPGGLSGAPLRTTAVATVRAIRGACDRGCAVVGCGGVSGPDDVREFLDAGADLVEAYTGFIYRGPFFCRKVMKGV